MGLSLEECNGITRPAQLGIWVWAGLALGSTLVNLQDEYHDTLVRRRKACTVDFWQACIWSLQMKMTSSCYYGDTLSTRLRILDERQAFSSGIVATSRV